MKASFLIPWAVNCAKKDYSDSIISSLALPCAMGDVYAMADMCQRHRELVKNKDLPSAGKKDIAFYAENAADYFHLYGEAFWYHRARAYCVPKQYPLLSVLHEKHELASALFPDTAILHRPGGARQLPFARERLEQLGLYKIKAGMLLGLNPYGYFVSEHYSGYEGPDDTGFGMENEYDYIILDEFFTPVKTLYGWSHLDFRNNESSIWRESNIQRMKNQQIRDQHWKKHDASRRGKLSLV